MEKTKICAFEKIIIFLFSDKTYLKKQELKNIFYSKEKHFKEALEDISQIKEKSSKLLDKFTQENAVYIAEQISLTVKIQ